MSTNGQDPAKAGSDRERAEPDRTPGAPHPDPRLAALGWHNCAHGIYVRRQPEAEADHEAA